LYNNNNTLTSAEYNVGTVMHTTLVHAFVTSSVDYCDAVYEMSPQTIDHQQATKGDERGHSSCQWHL